MNREIKFRAWFHNGEKYHQGQMLNDIQFAKSGENPNDWICISIIGQEKNIPAPFCFADGQWAQNPFPRQMFTLMQFTGLHDRTGKEIYESDLIDYNNRKCEILFNEECGAFGFYDKTSYGRNFLTFKAVFVDSVEIIGNIFENGASQ